MLYLTCSAFHSCNEILLQRDDNLPTHDNFWMQKSRQNFPNSTITKWYRGPTSFKCDGAAHPTISLCVARRQSVPYLTLSKVKLREESILPSVLDDIEKSSHGIPFNSTAQTSKMWDSKFVVKNVKNRGWHTRSWNWKESQAAQRMMNKWSYSARDLTAPLIDT